MSDFLNYLKVLYFKHLGYPTATGLILDDPSLLEALPQYELFAGGGEPIDWKSYAPPFRYQGSSYWCTAFAGTAIASIFEKKETGNTVIFSPLELFYRTGGSKWGNTLVSTANGMMKTLIKEVQKPTPFLTSWGEDVWQTWKDKSSVGEAFLLEGQSYSVKQFTVVTPAPTYLKQALSVSPLMIAIGIGKGYFNPVATKQTNYSAFHAVVLTGMDDSGNYEIFDSLTQTQGFSGFHKLASDYEILSALSFMDLPDDWVKIQEDLKNALKDNVLNHYGKKRDLKLEQRSADELSVAVKKNPTVRSYIGKEWTIAVNARSYGDYSIQDLLNHYTSIRRTGTPIFDLNKMRHAQ